MTHEKIFEVVKEELSTIPMNERSVDTWNSFRTGLKERFPKEVIKLLDSSGYIVLWLGDKATKGIKRVTYNRRFT